MLYVSIRVQSIHNFGRKVKRGGSSGRSGGRSGQVNTGGTCAHVRASCSPAGARARGIKPDKARARRPRPPGRPEPGCHTTAMLVARGKCVRWNCTLGSYDSSEIATFRPELANDGRRPWLIALIVLLVAGCIVTAVVVPICVINGCPPKDDSSLADDLPPGIPRLIVRFLDENLEALDVIPAILHQYITQLRLGTSWLQILDFVDEDVLQEALVYLRDEISLDFLTRDFAMSKIPGPAELGDDQAVQNIVDAINSLGRRSALVDSTASEPGGTNVDGMKQRSRYLQAVAPNDPFYVNGSQYYIDNINSTGAWAYTTGAPEIVVAILDSGMDMTHPDLALLMVYMDGTVREGLYRETPLEEVSPVGPVPLLNAIMLDGFIDDINGWDYAGDCVARNSVGRCVTCGPRANPQCDDAHGTHVAGLIAAIQNNNQGITGVAPNIRLMILRVNDCDGGEIWATHAAQAFDYAAKNGAHIVSCSFGTTYVTQGFTAEGPAPSYHADWIRTYVVALKPLEDKGILVVAASGNEFMNLDSLMRWGWAYLPCLAPFSNVGPNYVHVGAPGVQINSTLWQLTPNQSDSHIYGIKSGTSMATPITSGVAALVLSILGASDGNYYKATQVKAIIMASADKPLGSNLPFISGSRVNAGAAAYRAQLSLQAGTSSFAPKFSINDGMPQSASFQGFTLVYYRAVGNQFSQDISGGLVDSSADEGLPNGQTSAFTSFKFSTGMDSLLPASQLGLYINGNSVSINITTDAITNATIMRSVITATLAGKRMDIRIKRPTSTVFEYFTGVTAAAMTTYKQPSYALPTPLSQVWQFSVLTHAMQSHPLFLIIYNPLYYDPLQVYYNKSVPSAITREVMGTLTPSANYQYATVLPTTTMAAGQLGALLFSASDNAVAAIGYATATLTGTRTTRFRVTCKGCQVLLNGLVVLDAYEAMTLPLSLSKVSPCIQLKSSQFNELTIRFASNPLSAAALYLSYSDGCSATATSSASLFKSVDNIIGSWGLFSPQDAVRSNRAGYIGGLQCDAWRTANGKRTTSIPTTDPTWKKRLPDCLNSALDTPPSSCAMAWNFSLEDLFPGIRAASSTGTTFGVRCWTFVTDKITSGVMTATPAGQGYLGGRQLFGNVTAMAPTGVNTRLVNSMQQLAVEWVDVSSTTKLSVMGGGVVLGIDLLSMRLPIIPVADSGGIDAFGVKVANSNTAGTYTTAMLSIPVVYSTLLTFNLGPYEATVRKRIPQASNTNTGLDTANNSHRV
eukprot:gene9849-7736_t